MKIDPNALCYPVTFEKPEMDGGYPTGRKTIVTHVGLTKREWLIGCALQGYCANPNVSSPSTMAIEAADTVIQMLNTDPT